MAAVTKLLTTAATIAPAQFGTTLGGAGLIKAPLSSSEFRRFGQSGRGKWITIYARNGHTFAIIAGLRLDTTPYLTAHDRWAPDGNHRASACHGFEVRHPVGL